MEITKIKAERRTAIGRHQLTRLRAEGKVPAILYGGGTTEVPLSINEHDLERHVRQHHRVFNLSIEGQDQPIYLQEVQWDILSDRALHLDFLRIDLSKQLHLTVDLTFLGHPVGLAKGGRLIKDHSALKIACLPAAIPESIEVKVGHLDVGMAVKASEVILPSGVELDLPPETIVCHVAAEKVVVEAVAAPAEPTTAEPEVVTKGKKEEEAGGS